MTSLLIGIVGGLILGVFTTRESLRRQPVRGGWPAHLLHYLGASSITGALPAGLASLFGGLGIGLTVILTVGFMVAGLIALMLCSILEQLQPPKS